ncbi:hypothetical protein FACS1894152_2960 [Bacilli bacterium]|nr:hypothetical protein FACS1894152_2960 [Bacilli bacterium]
MSSLFGNDSVVKKNLEKNPIVIVSNMSTLQAYKQGLGTPTPTPPAPKLKREEEMEMEMDEEMDEEMEIEMDEGNTAGQRQKQQYQAWEEEIEEPEEEMEVGVDEEIYVGAKAGAIVTSKNQEHPAQKFDNNSPKGLAALNMNNQRAQAERQVGNNSRPERGIGIAGRR